MQTNKTHLPSTLTLIVLALGVLFLLALAAILAFSSLIGLFTSGAGAAEMIAAFAFGFDILLLLLCARFVLQKAMGRSQADLPFKIPFAWWQAAAGAGIFIFCVTIGGIIAASEIAWLGWLTLPALTVLAIVPPIWLLFGIGSNGLEAGPRWRFFAILGLSMTAAPAIMVALELLAGMVLLVGGIVFAASTQPDLALEFSNTMQRLVEQPENQELILELLAPYITNPAVLAVGIGFIAVVVPLIEELFKPLAVWLLAGKIESPAQGFLLGMLSGAGFALFESLNASADGSAAWAVIVGARAGTGILHITASGLVGWGIASAFKEKRIGRLVACYFTAVLVHAVWNAAAAGLGLAGIGQMVGKPEWLLNYAPALFCGLLAMGVGMFAALIASNRKLRVQYPA